MVGAIFHAGSCLLSVWLLHGTPVNGIRHLKLGGIFFFFILVMACLACF